MLISWDLCVLLPKMCRVRVRMLKSGGGGGVQTRSSSFFFSPFFSSPSFFFPFPFLFFCVWGPEGLQKCNPP